MLLFSMAFVKPADFLTMTTKIQNHCTAMQIKRSMSKGTVNDNQESLKHHPTLPHMGMVRLQLIVMRLPISQFQPNMWLISSKSYTTNFK